MFKSYTTTRYTCYLGYLTQSIIVTFTTILFIPIREEFGLSFSQLGMLLTVNFVTQVTIDILFSKLVDKCGYRMFGIGGNIFVVVGQILFAVVPYIFDDCYPWLIVSTVIFSAGGGLLELLLSPIISSLPTNGDKSSAISLLHAAFSAGQFVVVLITTLFLYFAGYKYWTIIVGLWSIPAIIGACLFTQIPLLPPIAEDGSGIELGQIIRRPKYLLYLLQIAFGTAAECNFSSWISAFLEAGLHINKLLGDGLGLCFFSLTHGIMRMILGGFGDRLNLNFILIGGSFGALVCYEVLGVSPWNALNIIACGVAGLCVSLLWPGSIIKASNTYPKAGASMFALLAAAGDLGAAIGGYVMGVVADEIEDSDSLIDLADKLGLTREELGLRGSFVFSGAYAIVSIILMTMTGYCVKETKYSDTEIEMTGVIPNSMNICLYSIDSTTEITIDDKKDQKEEVTEPTTSTVNPDDVKVVEDVSTKNDQNSIEHCVEINIAK